MTTAETIIASLVWAAIVLPAAPLGYLWLRYVIKKKDGLGRIGLAVLVMTTLSYVWFMAIGLEPDLFGPFYSTLRHVAIFINLTVGIVSIWLSSTRVDYVPTLAIAATWVGLLWIYTLVVSSIG